MFANGVYGIERSITPDPHPAKRTTAMQAQLSERIDQENRRIAQQRAIRAQETAMRNMEKALRKLKNTLKYTNENGIENVAFSKLRDERITDNALVIALNDFARIVSIENCITNETGLAVEAIHRYGHIGTDKKIIKSDLEGDFRDIGNNWVAFEKVLPENERSGINGEAIRYYNKQSGLYISVHWKGNAIEELSVYNLDSTKAPDEILIKHV